MSQFMKELLTSKSYTSKQGWQSREFNRDKFHTLVRTMLFAYVQTQLGKRVNYLLMLNLKLFLCIFL